ncbi:MULTISPECIES: EamA family transporter [Gordonia]|uniref:Membrane protein n=1 Tax=Gordonia jacobaea TaxID=122202 RepID=A0ABR5IB24_9ACTN|nr:MULTISPECIES: EamA family transporter [Gordonia]KNA90819.1 membrane protein [Gordonia jacobaea]
MTSVTHDRTPAEVAARRRAGLILALVSATSFGLSGALGTPLMAAGWSAGAVVAIRIGIGGLALLPFAIRDLGGVSALRWSTAWTLIRDHGRTIALYGFLGMAVAQFCYFSAIEHMDVGPALLIEYTAPVVVVAWMWAIHRQRPSRWALAGIAVSGVGLVGVLDLVGGTSVSPIGALWASGAMLGAAGYFIISAKENDSLPPSVLAASGMVFAATLLGVLGLVHALPMTIGDPTVHFAGFDAPAWTVPAALALVTAATAYLTGIGAARRLGARLASMFALVEVLAAVVWAAILLDQVPAALQIVGGVLIVVGVIAAKIGEPGTSTSPVGEPLALGHVPEGPENDAADSIAPDNDAATSAPEA